MLKQVQHDVILNAPHPKADTRLQKDEIASEAGGLFRQRVAPGFHRMSPPAAALMWRVNTKR